VFAALALNGNGQAGEPQNIHAVGVAQVDITPTYPVRLSGFGFRRTESEGVTQRIWAKALAIGTDEQEPAILITVDNLGVPARIVEEIGLRLQKKTSVGRQRIAITATHTHTAPMLTNVAPTLFGMPIPQDHQEHIDRYTREFTDRLEEVALKALADRKPARLSWGVGTVGFAMNRRTRGGPIDHDLPLLVVRDLAGKPRAVYVSYACHCVTLSNNKIGGDWAGYAQLAIEDNLPGVVDLVSIGCGADQNPNSGVTGDKTEIAARQGMEIATEVRRLLGGYLAPVIGPLVVKNKTVELPLARLPAREQWGEKAKRTDAVGYHARVQLARLDRGEALRTRIDYPVQTWAFGASLCLAFLPGEVVVDYGHRLKRELDGRRLWINAYSNDAPCYIPSERVLKEGGYEGGGAMVYYDVPGPFAPGLEQKIVNAVRELAGKSFLSPVDHSRIGGTRPLSPQQAQSAIQTKKQLQVDLVAAEPLVASPVAIDFGPDGRLWVAEMYDYPSGLDGKFQPGGRVRVLESTAGDGVFDKATVFLDNIPFPTGITVWRKGVLVCAAPDILYAEDTKRDGKADRIVKLFSGFGTHNYQARVNSLEYGLDGWVHGSCGIFGGTITCTPLAPVLRGEGMGVRGKVVALGNRDFRIKPDEGLLEPATGRTQQGRVRDDWGNWFGCDNSNFLWHYPLADHYLRRNPYLAAPPSAVFVPEGDGNRVYPASQQLQLFKLSGPPGRATAACGVGIYRDDLLGQEFQGNAFTCEPVDLLITRRLLVPNKSTFVGKRAADEQSSEFLASTDNWFRPVQVRTGPDGGLWIVDMYRYVIEHPRWIPPEDLATLDVRAGATMGRIYRVRAKDKPLRPWSRLDQFDTAGLVAALDSPNGWQRDMASQMLLWNGDKSAIPALARLLDTGRPEARVNALAVLPELGGLTESIVEKGLRDKHPGVRLQAARAAERLTRAQFESIAQTFLRLQCDPDDHVRLQVLCGLGELHDPHAPAALLFIAGQHARDPYYVAAALSSVNAGNYEEVLEKLATSTDPPLATIQPLLRIMLATAVDKTKSRLIGKLFSPFHPSEGPTAWQMHAVGELYDLLDNRGQKLEQLIDGPTSERLGGWFTEARAVVSKPRHFEQTLAAIGLLGRVSRDRDTDLKLLGSLLVPQTLAEYQSAALASLARINDVRVADELVAGWKSHSPALRSQVLDVLLSREAWRPRLLDFMEQKQIDAAGVDAVRRQRLLTLKDEGLRKRAEKLFAGNLRADRQKVVEEYGDVARLPGNAVRGKAVFAKSCSICHRLQGVGVDVGPDLAALQNKSPYYLIQEILDPNRNVDARYINYQAETKSGRTFTGLLASESSTSITLRGQEGKQQVLLRSDLEALASTGKSLMPEGLEKDLPRQDLADLIAYLVDNAPHPKQVAGNKPEVVKAKDGRFSLLASNCEIYGGDIIFEEPLKNIGNWHGIRDNVVWTLRVDKPGSFDVYLDWACADASAGNDYVLEGADPALRGKVVGTGGWDRYRQIKIGTISLPAGSQRMSLRPDGAGLRQALLDLRAIYLVPPGEKPATVGK
jgi:putative membrane-bound dehydrogenase-like protein